MDKQELRKDIKQKLSLYRQNFETQSETISKLIISSKEFSQAQIILAYMALPDEVNINSVITEAIAKNKTVYIPHVFPDSNQMEFYKYNSSTTTGSFGITEPVIKNINEGFLFDAANIPEEQSILILTPGRAFTKEGGRLGRGKGFYDIYFEKMIDLEKKFKIIKAGVCFPPQIVKELPLSKNDVLMNIIFQE